MRSVLFTLLLSLPMLGGSPVALESELVLAGAAEAAVTAPQQIGLEDHYGDPTRFVKYIIRRPPALA